jgi:hypothetical protein
MVWDDEQHTIVRCEGEGKWTWEEYHDTLGQIVEAVQQVDHRVDLIITRQEGTASSPPGSPMPHFQRAMRVMPQNVRLMILINTNSFGRALVTMFSRIFASRQQPQLVVVGSLEEARARIAAHRSSENADAKKAS